MRRPFLVVIILLWQLCPREATAQGGIRAIFWDYEYFGSGIFMGSYGLGYDKDMNSRLSIAVQGRYGMVSGGAMQFDYRSAFHFADNSSGSFYLGPQITYRRFMELEATQIPIGLRMGVRGGLQGFYADLFATVYYAAGDARLSRELGRADPSPSPLGIALGLHMGIGWDKRSR
ncbi:MAG: hypothetical protein KF797_11970 [Flavobacteriales bacterium]|nr:hypothetical protein [Flavobacteriales bacterium]